MATRTDIPGPTGQPFFQGTHKRLHFTLTDQDGAALDITDVTLSWQVSASAAGTVLLSKTTGGGGITITDAAAGQFRVALAPADTAALAGVYYWECRLTDLSGNVSVVAWGYLTIRTALTA